jgi:hypothetical protein
MRTDYANGDNVSDTPILRQYSELRRADFDKSPIWMCVYGIDNDEPWYGRTDEATYREWPHSLPFKCADSALFDVVVSTTFTLADGSSFAGFSRPISLRSGGRELSYTQPQMFLPDGLLRSFWLGMQTPRHDEIHRSYASLGKAASEVFPISYSPCPRCIDVRYTGKIDGIHFLDDKARDRVAR